MAFAKSMPLIQARAATIFHRSQWLRMSLLLDPHGTDSWAMQVTRCQRHARSQNRRVGAEHLAGCEAVNPFLANHRLVARFAFR
jgi:hypothetical protein